MYRYVFISLIGHILLGVIFVLITLFQPNYRRIPKQKITNVKFYSLPAESLKQSPPKKTTFKETYQPPKPKPTPPLKKIIKKEVKKVIPKPEQTPVPKAIKAAPTPKPAPQRTPRDTHQPTPRPQRTVWPPPPQSDSARSNQAPVAQPQPPAPSPNTPVQISHSNLPSYYLLMATQKIESNFNLARSQRYEGINCVVEFKVKGEGTIYDVKIIKSTGQGSLDQFALEAVSGTGSLGPLPDSIKEPFISITAKFEYSPDSN
jgi:TonB family protein